MDLSLTENIINVNFIVFIHFPLFILNFVLLSIFSSAVLVHQMRSMCCPSLRWIKSFRWNWESVHTSDLLLLLGFVRSDAWVFIGVVLVDLIVGGYRKILLHYETFLSQNFLHYNTCQVRFTCGMVPIACTACRSRRHRRPWHEKREQFWNRGK